MFKTVILGNWRNNSVFRAALPAEHNALTLRSIGPIVSEIWQNVFETLFLQIEETTVYSAQRYLLSTTRWHAGRLAQQFLGYDKMFKTLMHREPKRWSVLVLYVFQFIYFTSVFILPFNWIITLNYTNMSYNNNTPIVKHIITTYKLICICMFFSLSI